jgi:hypothetical protein
MRRVLVVFPEPASRWGGERLRKLCSGLPRAEWEPVFLAASEIGSRRIHGDYSQRDWVDGRFEVRRAADLNPFVAGSAVKRWLNRARPADTEGAPGSSRPAGAPSRGVRLLGRVWLPDYHAGWILPGLAMGLRLVRRTRPDVIFSSYPPASAHVLALLLHRVTRIPWVADFRDPWAHAEEHTYPVAGPRWVFRLLEQMVLDRAAAVTAVGPTLARLLADRAAGALHVLPQGFDPEPRPAGRPRGETLRLVHAGTLAAWPADPSGLLRTAARAASDGMRLVVEQVGEVFDCEAATTAGLEAGVLELHEPVPRLEALRRIGEADVAVLIRSEPGELWMTTKLWDYLATGTPILAIADPRSDAAKIVEETRTGVVVPYWDEAAIETRLRAIYAEWERGSWAWRPDDAALARYRSDAISRAFVGILEAAAR